MSTTHVPCTSMNPNQYAAPKTSVRTSRAVCNLALGAHVSGASRWVPNKGLGMWCGASNGVTDCSAILADPRCVLNIKSSAVIPLAAPNTNRGMLVAVATALLSNVASSGFASPFVSLFPFLFFLSSSLFSLYAICLHKSVSCFSWLLHFWRHADT